MTNEQIDNFLRKYEFDRQPVKISFRARNAFTGIFIKLADYDELRKKNFWRIVHESKVKSYLSTKDQNLARLFNGVEITKLTAVEMIG